jgi:hypothetical protein
MNAILNLQVLETDVTDETEAPNFAPDTDGSSYSTGC